jgi:shikimate kinase
MATVVLVGFSTTGKSTILRKIDDRPGGLVNTIDTDQLVARDFSGHIFNIYLELVEGKDRSKALRYIEMREEDMLASLEVGLNPSLIAAGPSLPIRKNWEVFCARLNPTCIFLNKSPEQIFEGLMKRRATHEKNKSIVESAAFGSWDEDLTTVFCNGKWVLVTRGEAVRNIQKHLNQRLGLYRRCAKAEYDTADILENKKLKIRFYKYLDDCLGVN